jgi:hypothetical protein
MINKKMTVALALIAALVASSCGGSDTDIPEMSKKEARDIMMKADDGFDWCEYFGWYNDDVCDTFCLLPDPDCEEPPPAELHKPVCDAIGSRSEGWYWADTEQLIKYERCAEMSEPECGAIGSRSEGWYSDNGLITWDSCHQTVRISLWGEACGPSIGFSCHTGLYCQGLPGDGVIGGSGECLYTGSCKTTPDCSAEGNEWHRPMCVGYASCEAGQCAWHCGGMPEEVWSWTTVLLNGVESDHPYHDNTERTWTVQRDGAARIKLHIHRLEVEYNYDSVSVYTNGQESQAQVFDGVHNDVWTREFDGDTINVTLRSDHSITGWGFKMMSVSYLERLPQGICNRDEDCPEGQICNPHRCFNPYAPCYGDCIAPSPGLEGDPCSDSSPCAPDLWCKQVENGVGTCRTEMWCSPETVEGDCANVNHIMIPGYWVCAVDICHWETDIPNGGGTFTSIQKYDIPDNTPAGITSPLEVSGLPACDLDVSVDVRIRHSYVGDLVVGLSDPSGARVVLWNREGGSQQDLALEGVYLTGQLAQSGGNGTWILDVSDHAWMDLGTLETWTLNLDCR